MFTRILSVVSLTSLLAAVAFAHGCGGGAGGDASDRLKVAASIPPQKWLIERIAGDRADVFIVLPPGASPHTHSPTDADATRVMQSRLYFAIGVEFEEKGRWFQAVEQAARAGRLSVVNTQMGIRLRKMEDHIHADYPLHEQNHDHDHGHDHSHDHSHDHHHHHHDGDDPHIWTSPRLLRDQARTVAAALVAVDPAHRRTYEANLRSVLDELEALEAEIRDILRPHRERAFLIYHPAWGYFAEDFGLRQIPIEIGGRRPDEWYVTELLKIMRAEQTRVVFVQPQVTDASVRPIAEIERARIEVLDPLAADVPDNLRRVARKIAESLQ